MNTQIQLFCFLFISCIHRYLARNGVVKSFATSVLYKHSGHVMFYQGVIEDSITPWFYVLDNAHLSFTLMHPLVC